MKLSLRFYDRELLRPLRIGTQVLLRRRGFWIEARDDNGFCYLSECAPLAGLHEESLDEAAELWRAWARRHEGQGKKALEDARDLSWPLAAQSSLSLLRCSWELQHRPKLYPHSIQSPQLFVSGLLHLGDERDSEWKSDLLAIKEAGYRTIKIKIGRQAFAIERKSLEWVRESLGPGIRYRLDANEALQGADLELWRSFLRHWPIDYLEDPGAAYLKDDADTWSLARDETVDSWNRWDRAEHHVEDPYRISVIKPNRLGLDAFLEGLRRAAVSEQRFVLSNCYESSLSLQFYAYLYGRFLPVDRTEALGFGTQSAFRHDDFDFGRSLKNATIACPSHPFPCGEEWPEVVREEVLWTP